MDQTEKKIVQNKFLVIYLVTANGRAQMASLFGVIRTYVQIPRLCTQNLSSVFPVFLHCTCVPELNMPVRGRSMGSKKPRPLLLP